MLATVWLRQWLMLLGLGLGIASSSGCGVMAQGQNVQGVREYQMGNYPGALRNFQQAIYYDRRNADAYYNIAATYHRLGELHGQPADFDQAESYYNQALDHNPDHAECYRALAVLLVERDRSQEAFRLLEGWADRNPIGAAPKIELARLFQEFGDREAAKEHLIDALVVEPDNARALAALGKLREDMGDYAQALAVYQRSLWQDRFQPEVAARVASLQSALQPHPATAPSGTRTVNTSLPLVR